VARSWSRRRASAKIPSTAIRHLAHGTPHDGRDRAGPNRVEFLQGGTVEIDIAAQAATWRETVAFLGAHLDRRDS